MAAATATAWGELDLKTGTPDTEPNESVGIVKEGSFGFEVQDGNTKEWKKIGGKTIDQLQDEPTIRISFLVKNLANKFWKTKSGSPTTVQSLVTSTKYSLSITPKVVGAEILTFWNGSISAKPVHSEDAGYGHQVTFTALYSDVKDGLFDIGKVEG